MAAGRTGVELGATATVVVAMAVGTAMAVMATVAATAIAVVGATAAGAVGAMASVGRDTTAIPTTDIIVRIIPIPTITLLPTRMGALTDIIIRMRMCTAGLVRLLAW